MEENEKLNIGIGEKETESLAAAIVKIEEVKVEKIAEGMEKAVFTVKHPAREELIHISAAKYNKKDQLKVAGLWFKLDEDNRIQKGSALQIFISHIGADNLTATIGKEIETIIDEKGYLCFKAY